MIAARNHLLIRLQLIPARGRKRITALAGNAEAAITTYPRKGTETESIRTPSQDKPITTYPRKGTETILKHNFSLFLIYYNLSPQGDGNL